MKRVQIILLISLCVPSPFNVGILAQDNVSSDVGYSYGYLSNCPGSEKPLKIPPSLLRQLSVIVYKSQIGQPYWKSYAYPQAVNGIANDPKIDWSKRTVMFVSGFLDSTAFLFARQVGEAYSRLGYNVLLLETNRFTTYTYIVSSRVTRAVGDRVGKLLSKLTHHGLNPKTLEILGFSLGAQISSFISKRFQVYASTKISRLTALDPAGPCFRNLPPNLRLDFGDADFVDVVHTNGDGLGSARAWGHVDFYVNGGEYQPGAVPEIPCSLLCSHIRPIFLWLEAVENPNVFVGLKCNSVQEARNSDCYKRTPLETNTMGLSTKKNATGIFYVNTSNRSPYGLGERGLKKGSNGFDREIAKYNSDSDIAW